MLRVGGELEAREFRRTSNQIKKFFFTFFVVRLRKIETLSNRLFSDSAHWLSESVRDSWWFSSEACLPCNSSASLTLLGICKSKKRKGGGKQIRTNTTDDKETLDHLLQAGGWEKKKEEATRTRQDMGQDATERSPPSPNRGVNAN